MPPAHPATTPLLPPAPFSSCSFFFFFNDTATTEIYTLSLHDALPICPRSPTPDARSAAPRNAGRRIIRSEEHTSELQSHSHLVCRLLLEKKTNIYFSTYCFKDQTLKNNYEHEHNFC